MLLSGSGRFRSYWILCAYFLSACFLMPSAVRAQIFFQQNQSLSFGEVVVINNNVWRWVHVTPQGEVSHSEGILFFESPTRGIYQFSGLTPGAEVTIGITVQEDMTADPVSAEEVFTLSDVAISPISATIPPNGVLTLFLGARANTTGNAKPYVDGTYAAKLLISITEDM